MKLKINFNRSMIAVMLTLCFTLGLLFTGYGDIATKAEEAGTAPHTLQNPLKDMRSGNVIWDCVWFGSYPQTEIVSEEDETQLAAMQEMNTHYGTKYEKVSASAYQQIAGASYNSNNDAMVEGVTYRRMKKGDATRSNMNNSKYYQWTDSTSYHYFRYEPIKWRVLSVQGMMPSCLRMPEWTTGDTMNRMKALHGRSVQCEAGSTAMGHRIISKATTIAAGTFLIVLLAVQSRQLL